MGNLLKGIYHKNNQTMVLPVGINVAGAAPSSSTNNMTTRVGISSSRHITTSYVDFVIVNDSSRNLIRCSRKAVQEHSLELTKLIESNSAIPPPAPGFWRTADQFHHYAVANVDFEDFQSLVHYMETNIIPLYTIQQTQRMLRLADRFHCPALFRECVVELDLNISDDTVFDVFRTISHYANMLPENQHCVHILEPKFSEENIQRAARKMKRKNKNKAQHTRKPMTIEEFGAALLNNVLEFIDMHAEFVLSDPRMNQLSFQEFSMIVTRDALQVSCETVVYNCLYEWAIAECCRRELPRREENLRQILGPLCYTPHYLLMTPQEFDRACGRCHLLDPTEILMIKTALKGRTIEHLQPEQSNLLQHFRSPRPEFANMPIHLSDRSHPKNYSKQMRKADKHSESFMDTVTLNCLTAFTCIFD